MLFLLARRGDSISENLWRLNPEQALAEHRADAGDPPLWREDVIGRVMSMACRGRQEALPYAWRRKGKLRSEGNQNALKHGAYTREVLQMRREVVKLSGISSDAS